MTFVSTVDIEARIVDVASATLALVLEFMSVVSVPNEVSVRVV